MLQLLVRSEGCRHLPAPAEISLQINKDTGNKEPELCIRWSWQNLCLLRVWFLSVFCLEASGAVFTQTVNVLQKWGNSCWCQNPGEGKAAPG